MLAAKPFLKLKKGVINMDTNKYKHLTSPCDNKCQEIPCRHAIKMNEETNRWFITVGHPGFNTKANNGIGYSNKTTAFAIYVTYLNKGRISRNESIIDFKMV